MINTIKKIFAFFLAFAFSLYLVLAVASFGVSSFSCSQADVVINSLFSCSATIQNNGDAAGTLSTATLYSDSENWLENSNYPQSYGQSVNPGNSITVTFSGLRATKSGNNGFSKIMLDSVTDTYVADNNKKVNIINSAVTVSNSVSSVVMGGSITANSEVTAGGNVDVTLTFTSNSGGCSIGSQTNPKTIAGMTDGSKQSRTWTITQGTSGDCRYTISATATGVGGAASKTDSTTSTISCTDCPVVSTTSSSSSAGGGGGGGGGASKTYILGELVGSSIVELSDGEKMFFNISSNQHTITLKSHTNTSAIIEIKSEAQTFTLNVGNEVSVDLNADNVKDILVKLKEITPTLGKVTLVVTRQAGADKYTEETKQKELEKERGKQTTPITEKTQKVIYILIGILIVIAIISAIVYFNARNKRKFRGGRI